MNFSRNKHGLGSLSTHLSEITHIHHRIPLALPSETSLTPRPDLSFAWIITLAPDLVPGFQPHLWAPQHSNNGGPFLLVLLLLVRTASYLTQRQNPNPDTDPDGHTPVRSLTFLGTTAVCSPRDPSCSWKPAEQFLCQRLHPPECSFWRNRTTHPLIPLKSLPKCHWPCDALFNHYI